MSSLGWLAESGIERCGHRSKLAVTLRVRGVAYRHIFLPARRALPGKLVPLAPPLWTKKQVQVGKETERSEWSGWAGLRGVSAVPGNEVARWVVFRPTGSSVQGWSKDGDRAHPRTAHTAHESSALVCPSPLQFSIGRNYRGGLSNSKSFGVKIQLEQLEFLFVYTAALYSPKEHTNCYSHT